MRHGRDGVRGRVRACERKAIPCRGGHSCSRFRGSRCSPKSTCLCGHRSRCAGKADRTAQRLKCRSFASCGRRMRAERSDRLASVNVGASGPFSHFLVTRSLCRTVGCSVSAGLWVVVLGTCAAFRCMHLPLTASTLQARSVELHTQCGCHKRVCTWLGGWDVSALCCHFGSR